MKPLHLTAIADDLTGAADSGSYFTQCGQALTIFTGAGLENPQMSREISTFNLSSRNVEGSVARQRHFDLCRKLATWTGQIYMKKIGTGFRGHDGFELEGMLKAMPDYVCFLIDNAPELGTFTLYGHQYCEGEILPKSLYAKDPILPPTKSYIPEILSQDTKIPVGLVDIDAVKGGNLLEVTASVIQTGARIIVFDAITDSDTLHIIRTLQPQYPNVFWTGSLGLASGLAVYLFGEPKIQKANRREIRSMCFCASAYDMAKRQIAYSAQRGLQVVSLDMDGILDGHTARLEDAVQEAIRCSERGNVLVRPEINRYSYQEGASVAIMRCMEAIVPKICKETEFDRLVVIGGETAQAAFSALGVGRLLLGQQLETGVAEGRITDGVLAGKEFALKGGSVGSVAALEKMCCHCGGER